MSGFWEGFQKKALLGRALMGAGNLVVGASRKAVRNPLAAGGAGLAALEGGLAASAASNQVASSKAINRQLASMSGTPGRTF